MLWFCILFCSETESMWNSGYLGTLYVDDAGLELTELHLPGPPKCWDWTHAPPCLACGLYFLKFLSV